MPPSGRQTGRQAGRDKQVSTANNNNNENTRIYVRAPEEVPVHRRFAHDFTHNIVTSEKSHFTQEPRLLPPAQDCRLTCAQ